LEDPQLRRLLRWLAAGQGTRSRALVTSRFPLTDLVNWKGAGHREERLEDLHPLAARAVLRGWGVKGDDATLDGLAVPLHYHALSVAVLGSYLGRLWGGDATKAPTFDRDEQAASDPKADRLTRILTHYSKRLPQDQRDLLSRLSLFPGAVTVESLGFLVEAGGQVAGTLINYGPVRLSTVLEQLRDLGLVFRYDTPRGAGYSVHPFLREYFRDLLGASKQAEIHEAVRDHLEKGLDTRRGEHPTESAVLDSYETLIEHTRLAGLPEQAFDLYWNALGNYRHLGGTLGQNARGLRILFGFLTNGDPETTGKGFPARRQSQLLNDLGLFALKMGDLGTARRSFSVAAEINRKTDDLWDLAITLGNQASIELRTGQLPRALNVAREASAAARNTENRYSIMDAHAYLACALGRMGDLVGSSQHFAAATARNDDPLLTSLRGILEAELKVMTGNSSAAREQILLTRDRAKSHNRTVDQAMCDTLLGLIELKKNPEVARQCRDDAKDYASRTGNVEVQIRSYHLATEIARVERVFDLAPNEAEAGIHLADTCGFGHYGIELRLGLARAHLDAGDAKSALQRAREALDRSVHPECQYAWGEADGLHLCGVAHARLGEPELARQRLTAALARREPLTHPGLPETRAELARLGG
jgi:tetratricopeptide (TPR) repeat protein